MKKRLSVILLFCATIIWGFAFIAQKQASTLSPFTVGALRSLLAALFIFAILPLTDRLTKNGRKFPFDFTRKELVGGLLIGSIMAVATTFQQYGIIGTDAGKTAFITGLYVVFVPIMSTFVGKKPSLSSIISIPIAICGFYLLCIKPNTPIEISDVLVLICAILFALHIMTVDHFSPSCDGVRMSFVQFAVAFLINTILAFIIDGEVDVADGIKALPSLIFLGIFSSGIAYTLQIVGQKDADPTVASLILSMESLFGVIGSAIFLGERMSIREYIGCGILLVALVLAQVDLMPIIKRFRNERNGYNNE